MNDACKVWDAVNEYNEKHPDERLFVGSYLQFRGDVITELAEALGLTYTLHPVEGDGGLIYLEYEGYKFFGGWS